jgi:pantothenate kinase type III
MSTKKIPTFVTLNIGNTNMSVSQSDEKIFFHSQQNYPQLVDQLKKWLSPPTSPYVLSCNVITEEDFQFKYPEVYSLIANHPGKLEFKQHWKNHQFFSMPVQYANTLGQDRLIQAYYLWKQLHQEKLKVGLLIDAGTMTTVDLVSAEKGFLGGYILPGMDSYADIFKTTKKLPQKNEILYTLKEQNVSSHLPSTTLEAITFSYWHGFKALIDNLHGQYHLQKIILSGGDLTPWQKNLSSYAKILIDDSLFPHRSLWQIGKDMLNSNSL